MNALSTAIGTARTMGPGWLFFRLRYAARRRFGFLSQRTPAVRWEDQPLASWVKDDIPFEPAAYAAWRERNVPHFFFDKLPKFEDAAVSAKAIRYGDALLGGRWKFFGHRELDSGFPPHWHANPFTGEVISAVQHWTEIGDFGSGDIKLIWETSRFTSAFVLARAYAHAISAADPDAARFAEGFWRLLEDWAEKNPPQLGPHWMCGQEISFRVMGLCFGLHAFRSSTASTPERIAKLVAMLAVFASRIEANLAYARSQKNNHGISEGVGLWTVGTMFSELRNAPHWKRLGRQVIEAEAARQIYDDGSYVQHSCNYHRLMLHDLLWAMRLGELNGAPFSPGLHEKVAVAVNWLRSFVDDESGCVPNYGGNDGALVLPLNGCDPTDFRPALQVAYFLVHRKRLLPPGPWDEELLWTFGGEALEVLPVAAMEAKRVSFGDGGYYKLTSGESWAMVRCAKYIDRPSHADQLHMDLWWRGINVACDAGTYFYNGAAPWNNALSGTSAHNTVTVDGLDQMPKASRFLWLDWAQGEVEQEQPPTLVQARHGGYLKRGVLHRRAILAASGDVWLVVDDLLGSGEHALRLHWLMPDLLEKFDASANQVLLATPKGLFSIQLWSNVGAPATLVRAGVDISRPNHPSHQSEDKKEIRGWSSRYYSELEPALSLAVETSPRTSTKTKLPVRFISVLAPASARTSVIGQEQVILGAFSGKEIVELAPIGSPAIFPARRVGQ